VELESRPAPAPMLQVTPALPPSLLTEAVKACVEPPVSEAEAVLSETVMGLSVMVAVADLVLSVLLVAVSVTVEAEASVAGAL